MDKILLYQAFTVQIIRRESFMCKINELKEKWDLIKGKQVHPLIILSTFVIFIGLFCFLGFFN